MARQPVKPVPIKTDVHAMLEEVAGFNGRSLKNMNETLIIEAHRKMLQRKKKGSKTHVTS